MSCMSHVPSAVANGLCVAMYQVVYDSSFNVAIGSLAYHKDC